MFLRRSKIIPRVAKTKKAKKKEPDSGKTTATATVDQESANKEQIPIETEGPTENQSTVRSDALTLGSHQVTAEPVTVETHDTPVEPPSLSRTFLSSQDESASSADEANKKSKTVNLPKFRKYKPRITIAVNKVVQKPSTSSTQQQDIANSHHSAETSNVSATVTSIDGKSLKSPSTHHLARPELSVSPSKHLIPAAPHCVPVTTDASSSEDEGVIDPYDPNNPQGARSDRERGRHRKNQRIKKTFVGGKPTAMIDYIFFNPKTNPMVHPSPEKVVSADISKEEEEMVDDPLRIEPEAVPAPQLTIGADGKLILDEKSLTIERKEAREGREALSRQPVTTATGFSSTKRKFCQRKQWTNEETLFFYKCLTCLGSDFEAIRNYFPGCTRHQIKLKFKLEEKRNPLLIDKAFKSNLVFDTTELDTEFLEISERARKEKEDKKNKRSKGKPGRPPAKKRSKTQKKKKGPKGRSDYYLESSTDNSGEESNASFSDEDFFGDSNSQSQTGEERKPVLRGSIKHELADLQSGRLSGQQGTATPNCLQTVTVNLLSPQVTEDVASTEHIAYLEIAESNVAAGRTLDPTELHVADVESIINSDSQVLMTPNDSVVTEVASEVTEELPAAQKSHGQTTSSVSMPNVPIINQFVNSAATTSSPNASTSTVMNPSSNRSNTVSATTSRGNDSVKHTTLAKLSANKDTTINVNNEPASIPASSSMMQTSSVPSSSSACATSSSSSSHLNQLLTAAPTRQSPPKFDHRVIPNNDGTVLNIVSRIQKPETILGMNPLPTTGVTRPPTRPTTTGRIQPEIVPINNIISTSSSASSGTSSVTTNILSSVPSVTSSHFQVSAVLSQNSPEKFDHRMIPNKDGTILNLVSRIQKPETILGMDPLPTTDIQQTSRIVSTTTTTRIYSETDLSNNKSVGITANSTSTNTTRSLPSVISSQLNQLLSTSPSQQSLANFDHSMIPNKDVTVTNILSKTQNPETILEIEPLTPTALSQTSTGMAATARIQSGTLPSNTRTVGLPVNVTSSSNVINTNSVPSVTSSHILVSTTPTEKSPPNFDHTVIPIKDGNIISRIKKPETILGIDPLPTTGLPQTSTSLSVTSRTQPGIVPSNDIIVPAASNINTVNSPSTSILTNTTNAVPSVSSSQNQAVSTQQSPKKFDHRMIPNKDGTVLNIVSRVQKPETILGVGSLPTTSASQTSTGMSATTRIQPATAASNNKSSGVPAFSTSTSILTNTIISVPSVTSSHNQVSTASTQQSPPKFDHRMIPNKDGTVLNIVSRVQKPETILGIGSLPTTSASQTSTGMSATTRIQPATAASNNKSSGVPAFSSSTSILTNTISSVPSVTSSHNQVSTAPTQQSPPKFDHRMIPNKDGTVLNIVSRVQKPETILGIDPLPTTGVPQISRVVSSTTKMLPGALPRIARAAILSTKLTSSSVTPSTSSLPKVTNSHLSQLTSIPAQQSSTEFDHRVVPNIDGTVTNIVSRVQKQGSILGPAAPLFNVNMLKILNSPSVARVIKISKGSESENTLTLKKNHSNLSPVVLTSYVPLSKAGHVHHLCKANSKEPSIATTSKMCAVEECNLSKIMDSTDTDTSNVNIFLNNTKEDEVASKHAVELSADLTGVKPFEVCDLSEMSDQTTENTSNAEALSYGIFADLSETSKTTSPSYQDIYLDPSLKQRDNLAVSSDNSRKKNASEDSPVANKLNIVEKSLDVDPLKISPTRSFIQVPIAVKTKNVVSIVNLSNISQQEENLSQSLEDMIVLPKSSTSLPVAPKVQKVNRRKAPLIIKIPFEEPCFLTSEELAAMEQPDSPQEKKTRKRKDSISIKKDSKTCKKNAADIKIVSDVKTKEKKKVEVPETDKSVSDEESVASGAKSVDDDDNNDETESSDDDYKYINRPTRSGRLPKAVKALVTEKKTSKRQARAKKISPSASPGSEKIPFKKRRVSASGCKTPEITPVDTEVTSPEQSEADSSFSEEPAAQGMPPPGSLIVCKSLNPVNNKETYTVFMVPPNTGGTTLEHNPDGTLQRLSVGSSAVAVLPASNSIPTMLPACFTSNSMSSSGHQMSAETLQAIAHSVVNLEAEPQETTSS